MVACAVVGVDTPSGPEPCAVLAFRGGRAQAAAAIEHANGRLAEFQRISRWELWPEPDLPRTSTGKVRRKDVAEWLAGKRRAAAHNGALPAAACENGVSKAGEGDWLLSWIAQITGEAPPGAGDELRLSDDLHLDSLGRVQLAAAIGERMGMATESGLLEEMQTLGELRHLLAGNCTPNAAQQLGAPSFPQPFAERVGADETQPASPPQEPQAERVAAARYIYTHWPWWLPFRWLRAAFVEAVMRPLVWLLAKPAIVAPAWVDAGEPLLIVANHVTSFDGPLLEYALPVPSGGGLQWLCPERCWRIIAISAIPSGSREASDSTCLGLSIICFLPLSSMSFRCPGRGTFSPALTMRAKPWIRASMCWFFPREPALPQANWPASALESDCSSSKAVRPCCPWRFAASES